jgi:tRNA-modifying protein YgfZ
VEGEPGVETAWTSGPRDRVRVSGPDASSYLHSQVSQDVRALGVGEWAWTFVLQPNGKVEVLARVTRDGEHTYVLDTDAGFGPVLLARLQRFKIRVAVELELHGAAGEEMSPEAELRRIRAAWPKMGSEIIPGETIPAETGLTDVAVNFTKGCYPGQELVERMDSRGASAPRRLVHREVELGTAVGDPVIVDGETVGVVTSVQGSDALALVKRGA